ncbi:MAG: phosphoserine transaminase [Alphaproteobacteria bacterium]|nr:phosphoserine transaminase [Alphaproteobacteria bacterium]
MTATMLAKPARRPRCPCFSSGPCAKRPGWSLDALKGAYLCRSHRAKGGKDKLKQVIEETKALLGLPKDYIAAIMPASDTGAVEAALWSLLGPRPVDVFAWESFGKAWVNDCAHQLRPLETRAFIADFGDLPDLTQADFDHDVVFTWNGTTSGVILPDGDWIAADRQGLTICDATSSVFAVPMPWDKLDVITFSWQKVLGGEAQHGMLVLSPRAVARLESHTPAWPIPRIFRLTKAGKLDRELFEGATINTPSMLCVEDVLDALAWARSVGGAKGLARRTSENFGVIERWALRTPWIGFLAANPAARSPTSVCLKPTDPAITALSQPEQAKFFKALTDRLEAEKVAYDVNAYRDAPAGLRIWCGGTVEAEDLEILTEWLDWAYETNRPNK